MRTKNKWIDFSILGLCTVSFMGFVLRSKIVFALPFVNYNHLLEAHSHFTFGGWITLALMTLMVHELLPAALTRKRSYEWLLGGITISAWGMMATFLIAGYSLFSITFSAIFILFTYFFGWIFIRDIMKAKPGPPVLLLAISSIICLIISSSGPFIIAYLYFSKTFDAIVYRDALFTYLHFQYNGFFSLAIFALLFNNIGKHINVKAQKNSYRFAIVLCVSLIPSLFLSYLWQDPNLVFRIVAIAGSFLLMLSFILFIQSARSLKSTFLEEQPLLRFLILLSMGSFLLKTFCQCFTVFPLIGNAIFGNRPVIMGFLHLVFLGFVSLFILAYYSKIGLLDGSRLTKIALMVFAAAVILNEVLLIAQGLTIFFIPGSILFPWLLWLAGISLFAGSILTAVARIKTKRLL
jgi:hypothetical protein